MASSVLVKEKVGAPLTSTFLSSPLSSKLFVEKVVSDSIQIDIVLLLMLNSRPAAAKGKASELT